MTTKSKKVNDQNEALFLLKTGTVLSVSPGNVMKGVYNDGHTWSFRAPPELALYPNSKVRLYRLHEDDNPNVSAMLMVLDDILTHSFVIGDVDGSEILIRHGVEKTTEEKFYERVR